MLLRFTHNHGMAFLKNLVDGDERLERLDLVGEDGLPAMNENTSVPVSNNSFATSGAQVMTYTFMPAQKAADDLWSHV